MNTKDIINALFDCFVCSDDVHFIQNKSFSRFGMTLHQLTICSLSLLSVNDCIKEACEQCHLSICEQPTIEGNSGNFFFRAFIRKNHSIIVLLRLRDYKVDITLIDTPSMELVEQHLSEFKNIFNPTRVVPTVAPGAVQKNENIKKGVSYRPLFYGTLFAGTGYLAYRCYARFFGEPSLPAPTQTTDALLIQSNSSWLLQNAPALFLTSLSVLLLTAVGHRSLLSATKTIRSGFNLAEFSHFSLKSVQPEFIEGLSAKGLGKKG